MLSFFVLALALLLVLTSVLMGQNKQYLKYNEELSRFEVSPFDVAPCMTDLFIWGDGWGAKYPFKWEGQTGYVSCSCFTPEQMQTMKVNPMVGDSYLNLSNNLFWYDTKSLVVLDSWMHTNQGGYMRPLLGRGKSTVSMHEASLWLCPGDPHSCYLWADKVVYWKPNVAKYEFSFQPGAEVKVPAPEGVYIDNSWYINFYYQGYALWDEHIITDPATMTFVRDGNGDGWKILNGGLPVELTAFTATVVQNKVHLDWTTASETNNYGFEVQRSINGTDFTRVAFVAGNGTTVDIHTYKHVDQPGSGDFWYRLKQIDTDGAYEFSQTRKVHVDMIAGIESAMPQTVELLNNYPNPFNPTTTIKYTVLQPGNIRLAVYDITGREVMRLYDGSVQPGDFSITWDGKDQYGQQLPSGTYVYCLQADGKMQSRRMTMLK